MIKVLVEKFFFAFFRLSYSSYFTNVRLSYSSYFTFYQLVKRQIFWIKIPSFASKKHQKWIGKYNIEVIDVFKLESIVISLLRKQQKMPSRQQKFAKKCSKRYLIFGTNHILATLRWDEGRYPGYGNYGDYSYCVRQKLRNRVFIGKC